jgi:uncharacterized membrane protein
MLTMFLQFYFSKGLSKEIFSILSSLLSAPLTIGLAKISLEIYRKNTFTPRLLLIGFEPKKLIVTIATYLIFILSFIIGLILLVIPGILVSLYFSQIKYIIAEDKLSNPIDILKKSYTLMRGNKKSFIFLSLRIFALSLLCVLTLGLGLLWFFPYVEVTMAGFYDEISGRRPSKKLKEIEQRQAAAEAASSNDQNTAHPDPDRPPFKTPTFEIDVNLILFVVIILVVIGYFLLIPK